MSNPLSKADALSPEKRELLDLLLKKKGIEIKPSREIRHVTGSGLPELSFAQQRLWFLDQLGSGSAYNMPFAVQLGGPLNTAAFRSGLNEIIRRHEALRTTFTTVDGNPVQVIANNEELDMPVIDLSGKPEEDQDAEVRRLAAEEARRAFDLARGPLFRAALLKLGKSEHVLLLTIHHIVSDGWSMGIFIRELAALYHAFCNGKPSPLPDLPVQYTDFAHWQRQWLHGEVLQTQLSYWRKQLKGMQVLQFPADRPRPAVQTFGGCRESIAFSKRLTVALNALSRREGVTLFMTMLAAFNALLYRYTGQDDIVVGSPIANRNRAEIEGLIGFFVNSLAVRTDVSGNPGFTELLRRVREVSLGAFAHQDLPFEKLVEELHPERDMSRMPLFQIMFALQNAPMETLELSGLTLNVLELKFTTTRFDLELHLWEKPEGLMGFMVYNTDLFDGDTISRMLRHYESILEGIVADPGQRISDLPVLTEAERRQQLVQWNDTGTDYPGNATIQELFEARVKEAPDATALVFGDRELTYGELNARANQLARYLKRHGAGSGVMVGICMERSLEMVVGLLGILKAGGAYVPLDPEYPIKRLAFMLEDTGVPVLLSQQRLIGGLPEHGARMVCLDADWAAISGESDVNLPCTTRAEDLAYVMYTSGSTGKPKGICVPHRAVNRLVLNTDYISLGQSDTIAQVSNCSFDAATFEIWGALLHSARLVGISKDEMLSPHNFAAQIREQEISTLFLTTAMFNQIAREEPSTFHSVKHLLFGGEAVDPRWVREVINHGPPRRLLHVYGPTESTTFASWHLVQEVDEEATTIPVGRPIANTRMYVLDRTFRPVPIGIAGELYIGGDGLAQNYLKRPGLTAERFIPDPFSNEPGSRLYRTGDLVRYQQDGTIEFMGRLDNQVKIRGYRIEPGEVEAVLRQHPSAGEVAVLAREDIPGDKRLVAYVVARQEHVATASELRDFLKEKLPDYMVPSACVILDEIPLTPNGKVDRNALPATDGMDPEREGAFVAPRTPVEQSLAEIWKEMLGVDQVGIYDNFFDLGGHSLLLMQAIDRLEKKLNLRINPREFMFQNLEQIASTCEGQRYFLNQPKPVHGSMPAREIEPFYFGKPGKPLFGSYKVPLSEPYRDCGVVLCYPMGEEYIRFHRVYRQMADQLSHAGFRVLRFDFYACGDSGGECEMGQTGQWLTDISTAVDEISRRSGAEKFCLIGFRLGGTLAMMAGAEREDIDTVVLFDPVINGGNYIEELIDWHEKMLRFAHVKENSKAGDANPAEILGFPVTDTLIADFKNIDLLSIQRKPAGNMLVIESYEESRYGQLTEHLKSMDVNVVHRHMPYPQLWNRSDRFMIEDVNRILIPNQILKAMVSWVSEEVT